MVFDILEERKKGAGRTQGAQMYTPGYFKDLGGDIEAGVMADVICNSIMPLSAIDVGCGNGQLLKALQERGISILGIDGTWAKDSLVIDKKYFMGRDLEKEDITQQSKYDVAICLEVAEHLNEKVAKHFISELCNLSDIVVFSSGKPYLSDKTHKNEQYASYWMHLFRDNGFYPSNLIRAQLWDKLVVPVWYKQNTILYVKETNSRASRFPRAQLIDVIHPEKYELVTDPNKMPFDMLMPAIKALPRRVIRRLINKIKTGEPLRTK